MARKYAHGGSRSRGHAGAARGDQAVDEGHRGGGRMTGEGEPRLTAPPTAQFLLTMRGSV